MQLATVTNVSTVIFTIMKVLIQDSLLFCWYDIIYQKSDQKFGILEEGRGLRVPTDPLGQINVSKYNTEEVLNCFSNIDGDKFSISLVCNRATEKDCSLRRLNSTESRAADTTAVQTVTQREDG